MSRNPFKKYQLSEKTTLGRFLLLYYSNWYRHTYSGSKTKYALPILKTCAILICRHRIFDDLIIDLFSENTLGIGYYDRASLKYLNKLFNGLYRRDL